MPRQDVLPSVFGKLHDALQSSGDSEQSLGGVQVRQVLAAWRDWEVLLAQMSLIMIAT